MDRYGPGTAAEVERELMEKILTVSYVAPENGDPACLMVFFVDKKMTMVRNAFYGIEAQVLYNRLTGTEFEIKSNKRGELNEHWLKDAFLQVRSVPARPAAEPFVIGKEKLEEILKEPVRKGPETLLFNKECPYGYKCRAMDCIECMEIYGKENNREQVCGERTNDGSNQNHREP